MQATTITDSKRAYPEWLKNHDVFKKVKIDKVFPRIGLPNFKESCDIMNTQEALTAATYLGNRLISHLSLAENILQTKLNAAYSLKDKDRNATCASLQSHINLIGNLLRSLKLATFTNVIEGKVVLRLSHDIFHEGKLIFRCNEALLRVINKIRDMCLELKVEFAQVDQLQEFKDFSRVNVPNKKYTVVFSSTGDEGLWDIGTISMRGITSCQAWNAPQSRGLIGSIASKFVGVMYLASDQNIPGYGSKMLNRCMIRFAVDKLTKKPVIIMDRMYPNENTDTVAAFKKVLEDKTNLAVHYTNDRNNKIDIANTFYIPNEPSREHLKQGEFSYMDFQIPVAEHTPRIKTVPKNILALTNSFKEKVAKDIDAAINLKRKAYEEAKLRQDALRIEFDNAKAKWELENKDKPESERSKFELTPPKMEAELAAFGKGGIINLMKHCEKKGKSAGLQFGGIVLHSIMPDSIYYASPEEYHRKYLMSFLKDSKGVKERSTKAIKDGSWMKSFPKSAEKLHQLVMSEMKGYVMGGIKEMIKPTKEPTNDAR